MMTRPAEMRPRDMGDLGPRMPGPRTPLSRKIRPQMWRPMRPSLLAGKSVTSTSLLPNEISQQQSQHQAGVTEPSEDPTSDPLALEDPAPALTFQNTSPSSHTQSDDSASINPQFANTHAKRPRLMSNTTPNPRTSPGPRVWKSPAPTPSQQRWGPPPSIVRTVSRPLVRAVSRPQQQQQPFKAEVITVEEDEERNLD